jgi:hypothetical protein
LPPVGNTSAKQFNLKFPPVDSTSITQFELDYPPIDTISTTHFDLDFLTAERLQAEYDTELQIQESYARQVQYAEAQLSSDLFHDLAEVRRLQSEWEAQDASTQQEVQYWQAIWQQEDQQMTAQVEFAERLLREEEEREEVIKKDVEAAIAAQAQWEADVMELEQQVRRAVDDAERREVEERRREDEEREMRAKEDAARRAENERRMRMAECVSCMEEKERKDMCELECGHGYCGSCVVGEPPFSLIFPLIPPFYDQERII